MAGEKEPVAAPAVVAPATAEVVAPASVAAAETSPPGALPPSDSAPAADAPAEPTRTPTLLEKFDTETKAAAESAEPKETAKAEPVAPEAKTDVKPTETKPGEAKAADAPKDGDKPFEAEPAALAPLEYKYALPETLTMDDVLKGEVHKAFDSLRTGDAQPLIDFYAKQRQQDAEQTLRNQFDTFNKTKETWEKDWLADPEIGGAGHRTALKAIARTRDLGISSAAPGTKQYEADRAQFDQFLVITGAGSHPAFARLLHNLSRFTSEPQAEDIPTDIKPTRTNGKAPKGGIYNHPSSANMDK